MTIYRLLNQDAKSWWYHKQLRERGNHVEARKRERQSILSKVKTLRTAYYFSVGRGGWSIHCRETETSTGSRMQSTISGYGGIDEAPIASCIKLGVPGYDSTTVSDSHIWATVNLPIISDTKDEPGPDGKYSSMSYAPLAYVLPKYRGLGATLYNY